jgi:hypothetical protein
MLMATSAKTKCRTASEGSQEVTTETAHHASIAISTGRNNSFSRSGSWRAAHNASTRNIPEKPI